jgi:uncharacterized delta-60 repeat protein
MKTDMIGLKGAMIVGFICQVACAQVTQSWVARYDGTASDFDIATVVSHDESGNVYTAGGSLGTGSDYDYALVKYNSSGVQQWVARYNGPGNSEDVASAITVDLSGNIYLTGWSIGSGSGLDFATLKYNSSGTLLWAARYNGPGNDFDEAYAIQVDSAGNVYVTGTSVGASGYREIATIKYNSAGTQQWAARYSPGSSLASESRALAVDRFGNVYVTGWRFLSTDTSGSTYDYITIKYNASGVQQWASLYNGPGSDSDRAVALKVDFSGNVFVTGGSVGAASGLDYATIKYNSSGVQQWVARYNGPGNSLDVAAALGIDDTGAIIVTGQSEDSTTKMDYATVKYNASGVQQWVARYDPGNTGEDKAVALYLDCIGSIYVTGESADAGGLPDYATVKYSSSGTELWVRRYDGPGTLFDIAGAISVDLGGNILVTGASWDTDFDYATIKYTPTPANGQPVAVNDSYSTNQDVSIVVSAPGVLGNDSDPDSQPMTAHLVRPPVNGTLTLNADGSFNYVPNTGYQGADNFTYRACDNQGAASTLATVNLTILSVGDTIGTCLVGDGRLDIRLDDFGSTYADFNTGLGGDLYDPPGALTAKPVTINAGLFLLVGTTHRELLSSSLQWNSQGPDDASLTKSITTPNIACDSDGDSCNDTLRSMFNVTGAGVSLDFSLYQSVRRAASPGVAYLVQAYRITNTGGSSLTFKLHKSWDVDLYWSGDWNNDEVGAGTDSGRRYVRTGEVGTPAATFPLSSLTAPTFYYGGKSGHIPTGGNPVFGTGTGRIWTTYGMPVSWRNYIAFLGYNVNGVSGLQTGEAQVGLEWNITLAAGASTTLVIQRTYGQTTPACYLPSDTNGDGVVDDADLLNVLFDFGSAPTCAHTDINFDGIVDDADLLQVLFDFGQAC